MCKAPDKSAEIVLLRGIVLAVAAMRRAGGTLDRPGFMRFLDWACSLDS